LLGNCAAPAHAATYYWNGIGASGSAGGGSGTWDLTTTNWQSAATSGSAVAWPNANNTHAASFGGTSGTVTWGSGMSTANPNGINVTSGTFTLNLNNRLMTIGGGGFTVTGAQMTVQSGTLTAAAVNGSVASTLTGANALTISAKITGSGVSVSKGNGGDLILTNDANDFTGKVYGQNGFGIYFSSIADAGVASAAGAGSLVQTGFNNTMVYTGTGASTNRTFEVTGGGSDALRNNGTGALIWTGSFSNTKSGASTLTLGGTNTGGSNEFRGNLVDGSFAMGLTKADSNTWILNGTNSYTGATTVSAGTLQIGNGGTAGSLSGSSSISVSSGATLAFSRSNTITQGTDFNSVISGAGNLMKLSSGTLVLSGSNTYTGTTSINAGTLQIGASGTTGSLSASSAITGSAGATLAFNRTDTYGGNVSNAIGGGIAVTQLGTGTVTLAGSNTFTGTTRIVAGGLTLGHANALQNSTLDMNTGDVGTLAFGLTGTNTYVIGGLIGSRNIATSGSVVLSVGGNGTSGTFSGVVSGGGAFAKTGAGTLALAGANTYTGTTTIGGGVLRADVADVASTSGALGNGGSIRFTGGTLQYTASSAGTDWSSRITSSTSAIAIDTNGQIVNLTGTGLASTNTGGLTKLGSGTLSIAMGSSTVTGTTTINGGVLRIANAGDLTGYGANRFLINNASTLIVTNTTGGNRTLIFNTGSVAFDAAGGGTFVVGSGNHLSQGSNTMTVRTNGGVQNVMSGGTSGGFINGQSAGLIVFDVARGTDPSADLLMSAALTNIGIQKAGNGILSVRYVTNSNLGITVSQGTFDVGGSATLNGGSFGGTIANSGLFQYSSSANQTLSGTISGAGSLTQAGPSTLTLSGSNSYSGNTRIGSGTLSLGNVNALGGSTLDMNSGDAGGLAFGVSGTNTYNVGGLIGSRSITMSGAVVLSVGANAASGTYSGSISGAGAFAKVGSGTLTLSAANGFTGGATLSAGTVLAGNANALGTGLVTVNSSTLLVNGVALSMRGLAGNAGGVIASASGTSGLTIDTTGRSTTFSGTIQNGTGMLGLTVLGTGTLTLAGNSTYSGGTQIAAGTLQVGNSTGLPTSSAVTLGTGSTAGVLAFNANTATLGSLAFNGTGSQVSPGGKLNLLAGGTNDATITVNSGSHAIHPDTTLQSNTVVDVAAGAFFSLHGVIDGTKSLSKLGSGTAAIYGANSYSGGTYLNGGYLSVLNTGALGSGTVTIDGNSILNLNNTILSNAIVFGSGSGAIINSGTLLNVTGTYSITSGTGTSITTNYSVQSGGDISFVNDLAATVDILSGARGDFTADVLEAGTVIVGGGGRGVFSGSMLGNVTTSGSSLFSGGVLGNVTVAGGTATFTATTGTESAVNVNSGLAVFTGTIGSIAHATQSGATIEIQGRVLGTADVNAEAGGIVKLMGSQDFDGPTLDNDGSVIVDRSANLTLGAVISGSGSLTKSDTLTLTLTGNNTFTGPTTISGGTLSVGDGGTSGALAGNVVNNAALIFNRSDDSTYAGGITGSGGLEKLGAGTLSLSGSSSYAGATTVTAGVLAVNGQISSSVAIATGATVGGSGVITGVLSGAGAVSPGNSPGILTADQFDATGGLDAEFEFTALVPLYTDSSASLNDVLRLTNGTPIVGSLTGGNVVDVYFNVDSIAAGDTFEGGFFTGLSSGALYSAVQNATFSYWIKDNAGSTSFNGVNYSPLSSVAAITGVTLQTANVTRTFTGGSVSGSVTQFVIVPEPGTLVLAVGGAVAAAWAIRRRR
jgi:autotransporter-associated beta strand protein